MNFEEISSPLLHMWWYCYYHSWYKSKWCYM